MKIAYKNLETIYLEEVLSDSNPFILDINPIQGEIQLYLQLKKKLERDFLCYQVKDITTPYPLPSFFPVSSFTGEKTYLCICKIQGQYLVMLTLSHSSCLTSLQLHDDNHFILNIDSNSQANQRTVPVMIVKKGYRLTTLLQDIFHLALQLTGSFGRNLEKKPPLPQWFDYLGFECGSENQKNVTHASIIESITRLKKIGYTPNYVIIGEGWQEVEKDHPFIMKSYDANPERFPFGLQGTVSALKQLGVAHVGVWHATSGGREGISAELWNLYSKEPNHGLGDYLGEAFEFYSSYYQYLKEQGVSFVSVSHHFSQGQALVEMEKYKNLIQAIQAAASLNLDSPPLMSESLRNANLFDWSTARLAGCTEKIEYHNPIGVKRFIRNYLLNSYWLKHLMEPDGIAWNTNDPMSPLLAMFHAISGTMNRISDVPSKSSKTLLDKMFLPSGELVRADYPVRLSEECLFFDPLEEKRIYKCSTTKNGAGIIGVFNLMRGKKSLHSTISPQDVVELFEDRFVVYSFYNGYLGFFTREQSISITLKPNGSDIFTVVPIKDQIAIIGCYYYYLTLGPIKDVTVEEDSLHINSAVSAPMILYCEKEVLEVRRNGQVIPFDHDNSKSLLSIDSRSSIENITTVYTITFE